MNGNWTRKPNKMALKLLLSSPKLNKMSKLVENSRTTTNLNITGAYGSFRKVKCFWEYLPHEQYF